MKPSSTPKAALQDPAPAPPGAAGLRASRAPEDAGAPRLRPPDLSGAPDRLPLYGLPAVYLFYFLRFGYDYGGTDQDELLPYLLHRLDPGLFVNDWFVGLQAAGFNVRTYVVLLLQGLASVFPVWLAVLLAYLAAWFLLAGAVYALGRRLTGDRPAALAAVLATLVLTPQWTLGGNDLAANLFVPSLLAWGIALWGVAALLGGRPARAGALLGLATWAQGLVGLQLAGLLGLTLLPDLFRRPARQAAVRRLLAFSACFLLAAAPSLGPLVYDQLTGAGGGADATPSLFYILAAFRNPHHYLFYSFPARSLVRFGVLAVLGLAALVLLHRRGGLPHRAFVTRVLVATVVLDAAAFVLTEVEPVLFVAKLQLFKLTVFAKLLFVVLLCGAAGYLLPEGLRRRVEHLLDRPRLHGGLVLAAWALVLAAAVPPAGPLHHRLPPLARQETPLARIEAWARAHTPPEAVFAVPPSVSTFRTHARRAIVVNFKAFPFEDRRMHAWFDRLTDLAPVALPERGGSAVMAALDAAYGTHTAATLRPLAARYGIDYVVRAAPLPPPAPGFVPVFRTDGWVVYRVAR